MDKIEIQKSYPNLKSALEELPISDVSYVEKYLLNAIETQPGSTITFESCEYYLKEN